MVPNTLTGKFGPELNWLMCPNHDNTRLMTPELAAPARDWEAVRAAVENGADAVYFGLQQFNARMRARNFTTEELPQLMRYLHIRGVKGYACINTIIFTDELLEAENLVRACIKHGVDGIVVQDIGLALLIRKICPDIPIHASTQMTITHSAGVKLAARLGCTLVVLARECSLNEIKTIMAETQKEGIDMPIQVFIHGALCVSYSGQCLTSAAFGGRSANRGECAQACRLPYELIVDGKKWECDGARFLLSTRDLNSLALLPDLIQAGVASLKIEGRMKDALYVANVVDVYRQVLDKLGANPGRPIDELVPQSEWNDYQFRLEMSFSRGFCTGWLEGANHERLVHGMYPGKRGPLVGKVSAVTDRSIVIQQPSPVPIAAGDGVVLSGNPSNGPDPGGRIYSVIKKDGTLELIFPKDSPILKKARPGLLVYKTSDPQLERALRRTFATEKPIRRTPLDIHVSGAATTPLKLVATDHLGNTVEIVSRMPLEVATKHPLTESFLADHLGRLGGTPFYLRRLTTALEGELIIPVSELNRMRRQMVDAILDKRLSTVAWTIRESEPQAVRELQKLETARLQHVNQHVSQPQLWVLIRSLNQLEGTLAAGATHVYLDLYNPTEVQHALRIFRSSVENASPDLNQPACFVALPRITKPGEESFIEKLLDFNPDGVLVRNAYQLYRARGIRFVIDATFNVANPLGFDWLLNEFAPERITVGYDLNQKQILDLAAYAPTNRIEVIIHQHMPMFHCEYCLFAKWIAHAPNRLTCGRPCRTHKIQLKDRKGVLHPVLADPFCRNTVFNGRAQSGAEHIHKFVSAGIQSFRIEFVDESAEEAKTAVQLYQKLLAGETDGPTVRTTLGALNQVGVIKETDK